MAGAYTDQRLNLSKLWEGRRKKCQGFKPDPGNAAVRDYRGGVGKRQPWWECAPVLQSKERETETPHLQRGAPAFYPNRSALISPNAPKSHSLEALGKVFALAQYRDAAGGARTSRHTGCRDRESEIVVAIDPKRGIRPPAGPSTPRSDMASPLCAESPC